jgi:predicted dehydrogenase
MRAILADGTPVHYFTRRALARPQTTWYGDLWIVGDEGALFWDGGGPVTLSRSLPTHDYRQQHLATGQVSYVNREGDAGPGAPVGYAGREGRTSPTMLMVRELVTAIREDRPHPCDVDDNWVSFATATAAVESAQTGRVVKVATE